MMLYHFNLGFPLLGEQTTIGLPSADSEARGEGAELAACGRWSAPNAAVNEAVYYHDLRRDAADRDGMAHADICNPVFPAGGSFRPVKVTLSWSMDTLPILVQWRMPGAGEHVLGLEPANCRVEGREAEAKRGGPQLLAPGASVFFKLGLNIA
jgi:hypothetical protein